MDSHYQKEYVNHQPTPEGIAKHKEKLQDQYHNIDVLDNEKHLLFVFYSALGRINTQQTA